MPQNLTQEFTFETDTLDDFEKVLNFICPIVFRRIEEGIIIDKEVSPWNEDNYPSYAASYFLATEIPKSIPNLHQFICGIRQSLLSFDNNSRTNFASENHYYSVESIVEAVLDLVKNADKEKFREETGEGPFKGCEGTVTVGYRIHWRWKLIISLCHIYYSK